MTKRCIDFLLVLSLMVYATAALANNVGVKVIDGEFDASGVALTSGQRIALTGDWCFNWQQFINPQVACPASSQPLIVPSKWNKLGDKSLPRNGYASYSIRLLLPTSDEPLALYFPTLYRAANIWLNGELVHSIGLPGTTQATETPSDASAIVELPRYLATANLVIHVSSFHHIDGGINQPIELALLADLQQYERIRSFSSVLLVGSSISFALYFLLIGLRGNNKLDWVYITGAATIMALTLRVVGVEQIWLMLYPQADANWVLRFEYFGLYCALPSCLFFLYNLFPHNTHLRVCQFTLGLCVLSTLFTVLTPAHIYPWLRDPWVLAYPIGFVYIFFVVTTAVLQQRPYAKVIGGLMAVIVLTSLHDYLIWFQILSGRSLVNLTYLAMIAGNVIVLIIRLVQASRKEEVLMSEINELNTTLQEKVKRRTAQLIDQQEKLAKQNEKLLAIDQLKTRFLTNISHEFRTPLTLIKGPLTQLESQQLGPLSADSAKAVTTANRNAARLSSLMEELLTLSHLESDQLKLQVQSVEINSFCQRITSLFEHQAIERELTFQIELLPHQQTLFFDPSKIETVLCNLLSNAFKYTPRHGSVLFKVSLPETQNSTVANVIFSVQDSGSGIPESLRSLVFERFYRLEEHDRSHVAGSGIGLSLVKEIAELHGGSVSLKAAQSGGCDFNLYLPLGFQHFNKEEFALEPKVLNDSQILKAQTAAFIEPAVSQNPTMTVNANSEQKTLLLVEDVRDMRDYIADHFRTHYQVLDAENGQQALDILQSTQVDLVITDLMMPVMDGLELLANIRVHETLKHLPVLMLSARSSNADRNLALAEQANDYLAKPFDSEELVLRARNLMARPVAGKPTPNALKATSAEQKFLAAATEAVSKHVADAKFDAKQLAQQLNVSKATLHRHLEKAANTTPAAFIRDHRLALAQQLISANSHRTLAEVAYAVGFNSPGYFSRLYKQRYGEINNNA